VDLLVNIDVPELDAAVAFYTRAFGLTVGRRFGEDGVELLGAVARIYLLAKPAGTTPAPGARPRNYARHWTPVHLDFVVPDVAAAVERAVIGIERRDGRRLEAQPQRVDAGLVAETGDQVAGANLVGGRKTIGRCESF